MSRILIVEDEQHIADGIRFNLEAEGHEVDVAESGEAALDRLQSNEYQLLVLDIMLPGMDGFSVMSLLRDRGNFIPTLMLTARGRPEDILRGFETGADDYLPKPFDLAILIARVRSLLRRNEWMRAQPPAQVDIYSFCGRTIDFHNLELHVNGTKLQLTLMEANLLRYLVQHEGKAVSRKSMLDQVWNVHEDTDTRAIDNFVVRLRKYIEDEPSKPRHLVTVRGVGYKFIAEPE